MVEALWSRVVFHHLTDQNEWHVAFVYLIDQALMRLNCTIQALSHASTVYCSAYIFSSFQSSLFLTVFTHESIKQRVSFVEQYLQQIDQILRGTKVAR